MLQFATVRSEIADFVESLIFVYVLIIIAYIVTSLVFSFGLRMPYSRPLNAVLEFLRDVTEPYLRIFRRLPLRIGPLDLTPIVAILALQFGGAILVGIIDG
jgi:YggT family protein